MQQAVEHSSGVSSSGERFEHARVPHQGYIAAMTLSASTATAGRAPEVSGEFHFCISDLGNSGDRPLELGLHERSERVQLNSDGGELFSTRPVEKIPQR